MYTLKVQYVNGPRAIAAASDNFQAMIKAYRSLKNKGLIVYARISKPGQDDYIIA